MKECQSALEYYDILADVYLDLDKHYLKHFLPLLWVKVNKRWKEYINGKYESYVLSIEDIFDVYDEVDNRHNNSYTANLS